MSINESFSDCDRLVWCRLSFSFGRALQASSLKACSGKDVAAGQEEFLRSAYTILLNVPSVTKRSLKMRFCISD